MWYGVIKVDVEWIMVDVTLFFSCYLTLTEKKLNFKQTLI